MHSNLYKLYYNLGHVLHQQGDWVGAANCYRQVIALNPEYVSAHHNLGAVLDEQGRRPAAIASYQRAIALQPDHLNAHNNLGGALLKQGQVDEAIQVYRQALALQPTWAILHTHLGQALQSHGDVDGAIAAYRRAIALQPDMVAAHYGLGKLLHQQQHYAAAVDGFKAVIDLEPDHKNAYSDLSSCFLALGQWEAAMGWLHRAIAQFPQQQHFVDAFCQWVDGLAADSLELDELTQTKRACSQFLKTLLKTPNNPKLYHHLAQTYLHLGSVLMAYGGVQQYQQAEGFYQKALQLIPDCVDLYLRLGHCLTRQKRMDAALALYHLALAKYPSDSNLRLALRGVLGVEDWKLGVRDGGGDGGHREDGEHREDGAIALSCPIEIGQNPERSYPQRIYSSTWEWFHFTKLDSHHYIPLLNPTSPLPNTQPPTPNTPSCSGLNCIPCLQKILSRFEPVQLEQGIYGCTGHLPLADGALPTFVATIPQGRTWVVPQRNSWMVCNAIATFTADGTLLADLSREYPGQLPGCQHSNLQHRALEQDPLPSLTQMDGTVAVLAGLSGNTYYHWMIDVLPRFELLRRSGIDLSKIDWFLVNNNRPGFQQETLDYLGIPSAKILPSDRHPHIQAQQLIVPSFPGYLGWSQPWALEFLRREFLALGEVKTGQDYPQKIYISRATATYRRVLNEADVIKYLDTFGFVAIALESLSFQQQVALFSHAKIIISPHGSGLTNTIFSKPGTKVIELVSPHYIRHYYWLMSQYLGLSHYYISGKLFSCYPLRELMYQNPLTEDILVSLNSLQRLMKVLSLAA